MVKFSGMIKFTRLPRPASITNYTGADYWINPSSVAYILDKFPVQDQTVITSAPVHVQFIPSSCRAPLKSFDLVPLTMVGPELNVGRPIGILRVNPGLIVALGVFALHPRVTWVHLLEENSPSLASLVPNPVIGTLKDTASQLGIKLSND